MNLIIMPDNNQWLLIDDTGKVHPRTSHTKAIKTLVEMLRCDPTLKQGYRIITRPLDNNKKVV